MKKYLFIGLVLVVVLMTAGCKPGLICGDGVCSSEIGETFENCLDDCPSPEIISEQAEVSINPATTTVNNGGIVTLDITVSNIADLFGFQFDISYDASVLEFQEVQEGTFLNNNGQDKTFCIGPDSSPGLIKNIVCSRLGEQSVSGSGVLETLVFKAITTGESDISILNVKLVKSSGEKIASATTNGKVIVE